jgi:YebC/PmpR family DNA-binding regulatory protein
MSGHSKWSTIKRKKGAADQKRGMAFSKLIKAIMATVRENGPDPDKNANLRALADKSKAINMPSETLKRAIERGSGAADGVQFEEINYEGYGPMGVAVLVQALTDNKNRTTAEVRHILTKHGGSMGAAGCVAWMFEKKGVISVTGDKVDGDLLMETAIENGAEEVDENDGAYSITCPPQDFESLKKAITDAGFVIDEAEISMEPQTTVTVDEKNAPRILKIMNQLEENDDVQNVYANFDISDEIMQKIDE